MQVVVMLEYYWRLVSATADERREAAQNLVSSLKEAQAKVSDSSGSLASDVDYAIKRLVRGLSSSTEAARQGFAACLTEVLSALPQVPLPLVFDLMTSSTEITGSIRGQDERDLLLGRLFTCLVVARSGRLKSSDQAAREVGLQLLDTAVSIFTTRKVLRTLAATAVVALMEELPVVSFEEIASKLALALGGESAQLDALNPDQLLVALSIQAYLSRHGLSQAAEGKAQAQLPHWVASKPILKAKRMGKLVEALKLSSASFPQLHPVWDFILDALLDQPVVLQALWNTVVDGTLAPSTSERKALCLLLLQRCVKALPPDSLAVVLTPQVLRIILTSCSPRSGAAEDHLLASLAKQTLEILVEGAQEHTEKRLVLASALLTRCDPTFDQRTGTQTVATLLVELDQASLEAFFRRLVEEMSAAGVEEEDKEEGEEGVAQKKAWMVDAVFALGKSPAVTASLPMGAHVIRLLMACGYFDTTDIRATTHDPEKTTKKRKKDKDRKNEVRENGVAAGVDDVASWIIPKVDLSEEIRTAAAARLQSLIADLISTSGQLRFGETSDGKPESLEWLWLAHDTWQSLQAHGGKTLKPLSKQAMESRAQMLSLVGGMREELRTAADGGAKTGDDTRIKTAFAALLMQVGLLALGGGGGEDDADDDDEEGSNDDVIGDLCRCYEDMMRGKGKGKLLKKDEGDVDVMAVLADACVSVLSSAGQDTAVRGLRQVVRRAWAMVCASCALTPAAVEVLLEAVCGSAHEGGENGADEAEDGSSSSGGDHDGEEEEEGGGDNGGAVPMELSNGHGTANRDDDDSMADDDDNDDDDDDDGRKEDEVMVDSEGLMRLFADEPVQEENDVDVALKAFAKLGEEKRGKREARKQQERAGLQWRLRALDLLEAVALKQHTSPLLLLTLWPCIKCIKSLQAHADAQRPPEHAALAKRLADYVTKKLGKARPKAPAEEKGDGPVSAQQVEETVGEIVTELRKNSTTGEHAALLQQALVICTRSVLAGSSAMPEWLTTQYRALLQDFMTTRTGLTAAPLEQLITRFPGPACQALLEPLAASVSQTTKAFRQAEALRLIGLILSQRKAMPLEAQAQMRVRLTAVMEAASSVLEDAESLPSKRLKPIVDCCHAVASAIAETGNGKGKAAGSGQAAGHAEKKLVGSPAASKLASALNKAKESTNSEGISKQCGVAVQLLLGDTVAQEKVTSKKRKGQGAAVETKAAGDALEEQAVVGAPKKKQKKQDKKQKPPRQKA